MSKATKNTLKSENSFYWNTYIPLMDAIFKEAEERKRAPIVEPKVSIATVDGTQMVSRTKGNMLQIYKDGDWEDIFIHGVNIGDRHARKMVYRFP